MENQNIVVIAYGSLKYNLGKGACRLEILDNRFNPDGPLLPLEYARISGCFKNPPERKLSLVIRRGAELQETYWSIMKAMNLEEALKNLARRETMTINPSGKGVYFLNLKTLETNLSDSNKDEMIKRILIEWAKEHLDIDIIIFSNWKSNFKKRNDSKCIPETAIEFLKKISPRELSLAKEYIEKTNLDTFFSRAIKKDFDW